MKKVIFTIFLLLAQISYSQEKIEQKAFDYFINNIMEVEYPKLCKIKFSGVTEPKTSGFFDYVECLKDDENTIIKQNGFKTKDNVIKIENDSRNILNKKPKRERKQKVKMLLFQASAMNNEYFVTIEMLEKEGGQLFYLIFDKDYEIVKWCKDGFIF